MYTYTVQEFVPIFRQPWHQASVMYGAHLVCITQGPTPENALLKAAVIAEALKTICPEWPAATAARQQ